VVGQVIFGDEEEEEEEQDDELMESGYAPSPSSPWTVVFVDVETTGFSSANHHIWQISARIGAQKWVKVINAVPPPPNPPRYNGIWTEWAAKNALPLINNPETGPKVSLKDALSELVLWINSFFGKQKLLVAHQASFDRRFLLTAFDRVGLPEPDWLWFDLLKLAKLAFPGWPSHTLENVRTSPPF
jgi:DNA polymerase-3 subunit epsilon